jgi:hypothetical protein
MAIVDCRRVRKVDQFVCFVLRVGARWERVYLMLSLIKTGEIGHLPSVARPISGFFC